MASLMDTITAKSDQLNADDLMEPRTVTITGVTIKKGQDQPVTIHFEGDNGKPYKPCLTCRRILGRAWGNIESGSPEFNGRQIALYTDPAVKWGGQQVGGVRISGVSHIERDFAMPLTITRGQKKPFAVKKLQVQESKPTTLDPKFELAANEGLKQALTGGVAYVHWWKSQSRDVQSFLVESGNHETNKAAAEAFDNPPTSEDDGT